MDYPYRHILIIAAAEQGAANAAAAGIDPDDGGEYTFSVPLSPDGTEPATHYGANSVSSEPMRQQMEGAEATLTSIQWWRLSNPGRILEETSTPHGAVGEAWTWEDALTALGLQRVQPGAS